MSYHRCFFVAAGQHMGGIVCVGLASGRGEEIRVLVTRQINPDTKRRGKKGKKRVQKTKIRLIKPRRKKEKFEHLQKTNGLGGEFFLGWGGREINELDFRGFHSKKGNQGQRQKSEWRCYVAKGGRVRE